jgi:hypothetical protein
LSRKRRQAVRFQSYRRCDGNRDNVICFDFAEASEFQDRRWIVRPIRA